jgi:hypothetical protein
LKGVNIALTAISNFVLAYVPVRAISLDTYAVLASLLAIAALVVQSDLGITGLTLGITFAASLVHAPFAWPVRNPSSEPKIAAFEVRHPCLTAASCRWWTGKEHAPTTPCVLRPNRF